MNGLENRRKTDFEKSQLKEANIFDALDVRDQHPIIEQFTINLYANEGIMDCQSRPTLIIDNYLHGGVEGKHMNHSLCMRLRNGYIERGCKPKSPIRPCHMLWNLEFLLFVSFSAILQLNCDKQLVRTGGNWSAWQKRFLTVS